MDIMTAIETSEKNPKQCIKIEPGLYVVTNDNTTTFFIQRKRSWWEIRGINDHYRSDPRCIMSTLVEATKWAKQ